MPETKRTSKETPAPLAPPAPEGFTPFLLRFERFAWDIAGVLTLVFSLLTLLGLAGTGGSLLELWAGVLWRWLGWGSLLVVATALFLGWRMLLRRKQTMELEPAPPHLRWERVLSFEAAAFAFMALLSILNGVDVQRAEVGNDGGLIGWGIAEMLTNWMPAFLAGILLLLIILAGIINGLGWWQPVLQWIGNFLEGNPPLAQPPGVPAQDDAIQNPAPPSTQRKKPPQLPAEFRKNFRLTPEEELSSQPLPRDERLPPLDLLAADEHTARPNERHINLTAGLIEKTFSEFGIPARVVGFQVGPTVTQFAVEPGFVDKPVPEGDANRQKVRVAQIAALQKDLTLALSATRLRIEAPVPGRPYIGIEVPNTSTAPVRLRTLLETERFQQLNSPLAVALGRDVSGKPVLGDLEKMPHLLIAGTTGSGKSICIAALALGLVMNNTPEDMRLIMIDPKMVELVRFNGLPHLYGKVETDVKRILGVLRWTVTEMERRYRLLEESRSRHITSYNRKMQNRRKAEVLPRIVVFIDELADLMMSAAEQTEFLLVCLAQLARATGIHLVVATQRPSTDVVTGLIKANFPARLSFTVASGVDSRVILDVAGAESLLGRGDMLFLPPDAPAPIRSQGVMVTDQEIERVINFWKKNISSPQGAASPWEDMLLEQPAGEGQDHLTQQAIEIIRQTGRANTSLLQRRLRIGYPRAARLMDDLEDMGIVGAADSAGRGEREVLIETLHRSDDLTS